MEPYDPYPQEDSRFRREFGNYLSAVARHWRAAIGVVVGEVLVALAQGLGAIIPPWIYVVVMAVGVVFAAFFSWREQYRIAIASRQEVSDLRDKHAREIQEAIHRIDKSLEIEWQSIDLGWYPLSAPNLRIDILNNGETSLDDVGVLVNQIDCVNSLDVGDMPTFPICCIPGPNKKRLNPQERLTVDIGAILLSNPTYTGEQGPYAILRLSNFFGGLSNSYFSFRAEEKYKLSLTATAKDAKIPMMNFYISAIWTGPEPEEYQLSITTA